MKKKTTERAVWDAEYEVNRGGNLKPGSGLQARRSPGFTYVALLAAIVIIGISLGVAGKYWQNAKLREKEEELLFRGNQYRSAIERYYTKIGRYPPSIESLLNENDKLKRNLRQQFKDPMTGEDFEVVQDPALGPGIIGVHSKSDDEPLRQTGFPEENKDFEGLKKYSEWKFMYLAQQRLQQRQGRPLLPPGSMLPPGGGNPK